MMTVHQHRVGYTQCIRDPYSVLEAGEKDLEGYDRQIRKAALRSASAHGRNGHSSPNIKSAVRVKSLPTPNSSSSKYQASESPDPP